MKNKQLVLHILYWVAWGIGLILAAHYWILDIVSLVFFFLSAGAWVYGLSVHGREIRERYHTVANRIVLWLIAFYLGFILYGRSIFMVNERISVMPQKVIAFLIIVISLYPVTIGIFGVMDLLSRKGQTKLTAGRQMVSGNASAGERAGASGLSIGQSAGQRAVMAGLICGAIVLVVLVILSLASYPCNMTHDSVGHWEEASGAPLTDYNPLAYTLLMRGLVTLFHANTPYVCCLFQIVLFAVIVGDIACFLRRRGVSLIVLIVGSLIISFCPSTYMLLMYLSKNPLAAILNLWVMVSLIELLTDQERYLRSWIWYVKTILTISMLFLVRQNNMVIAVPILALMVWFVIRYWKAGLRILIVLAGCLCVVGLMEGVVFRQLDYKHIDKPYETVRPLLAPVASAVHQGLELPDDVLETAQKVLPLEEWEARYDPFNSDLITWASPMPQYGEVSLGEAFHTYFEMLSLYPDVVIRDRLDGMNLVWDVRAGQIRYAEGLQDDLDFKDVKLPETGLAGTVVREVKGLTSQLLQISVEEKLADMFIWKNGIYVYLLFVVVMFLFKNKRASLLWAILPSVFILLTYIFVIGWQMYFYIWFFPLAVVLMAIVGIVESRPENGIQEDGNHEDGMRGDGIQEDRDLEDSMQEDGIQEDGNLEDGMQEDGMQEDGIREDGIVDGFFSQFV